MDVAMTITVSNDYHAATLATVNFDFLFCVNYYRMLGSADFSIAPGASSGDLSLDLLTDSSAVISWTAFTYDHIACDILLYRVVCVGPDQRKYQVNADGSDETFGHSDSLCEEFTYLNGHSEREILVDASSITNLHEGQYTFEIIAYSSEHSETASLTMSFTIFADCADPLNKIFDPAS